MNLTPQDRERLATAIDSHTYWQLADDHYKRDGFVLEPGSDDPDTAEEIAAYRALSQRLTDEPTDGPTYFVGHAATD